MQSKFWADSSDEFDSDDQVSQLSEQEIIEIKKPVAPRWTAVESSSSEDEVRVVRSLRDRRWDAMRSIISQMQNHQKIGDYSELYKDYEQLLRSFMKATTVVEKEGVPKFFIRTLVSLDYNLESLHKDKIAFKKLSKAKATAFNTLRAKVRKSNEEWLSQIEECKTFPEKYESSGSESEDTDFDDDESESEYDDDSDDGGKDSDNEKSSLGDSDSDEEHKGRKKKKISKAAAKAKKAAAEEQQQQDTTTSLQDLDPSMVTAEVIQKRVQMVLEKRGRRGVDRQEQIRVLRRLCELSLHVSPQCFLETVGHVVNAEFDITAGMFTCLHANVWDEVYGHIRHILVLMFNDPTLRLTHGIPATPEEVQTVDQSEVSSSIVCSFLERIDDELTKTLQFTDVHSDEYKERLGQIVDVVALLWIGFHYFRERNHCQQASSIALRITELMHCITNPLSIKILDMVRNLLEYPKERKKVKVSMTTDDSLMTEEPEIATNAHKPLLYKEVKLTEEQLAPFCEDLICEGGKVPSDLLYQLVQYIFAHGNQREKTRALLHLAFSRSLHGLYHEARDLLQTPNVQELALSIDVHTQILFNRSLVQLGLCAFRKGFITDAHACLSDICNQNKHKELLAQGVSSMKSVEKTAEQERAEKRRLLPYHMHISLELVECAHNVCAMLLEVPRMARDVYATRISPISRHFRRMLEMFDRQPLAGPPENARETIMCAAKALQKGDWLTCDKYVSSIPIWEKFEQELPSVMEMLKRRIKQEAMRTYIFTYLTLYDSFSIDQLCGMFDLTHTEVHSIVSKLMVNEEIHASWDEKSECILISRGERSHLQQLAVILAESVANAVEQNELTLNMKNPKFALAMAADRRFQPRDGDGKYGGGHWGQRGDGGGYGQGYYSHGGGGQYGGFYDGSGYGQSYSNRRGGGGYRNRGVNFNPVFTRGKGGGGNFRGRHQLTGAKPREGTSVWGGGSFAESRHK